MSTFLTSLLSLVSLLFGTWLGAHFSMRNALKALELQNAQTEKERREERQYRDKEQLQQWFEKYAIEECIDPLLAEILYLQEFLVAKACEFQFKTPTIHTNRPAPPYEAYTRIFVITGAANFPMLSNLSRTTLIGALKVETGQKYMQHLNLIRVLLIRLRQYLITIEIKNKRDIHNLCNIPRIQKLAEAFDQQIDELLTGKSSGEVSPLTDMLRRMSASIPEK
jgi:hypothetical protein